MRSKMLSAMEISAEMKNQNKPTKKKQLEKQATGLFNAIHDCVCKLLPGDATAMKMIHATSNCIDDDDSFIKLREKLLIVQFAIDERYESKKSDLFAMELINGVLPRMDAYCRKAYPWMFEESKEESEEA